MWVRLLLIMLCSSIGWSISRAENISDVDLMASGQWRDPKTELIWMRCSIGQVWDGKSCKGKAITLTWQNAHTYLQEFNTNGGFAGHADWQLPSINQLVSLRQCSKGFFYEEISLPEYMNKNAFELIKNRNIRVYKRLDGSFTLIENKGIKMEVFDNGEQIPDACNEASKRPSIDSHIFPNTPTYIYWSNSVMVDDPNYAWALYFGNGDSGGYEIARSDAHVRFVRFGK